MAYVSLIAENGGRRVNREQVLKVVLVVVGLIFLVGVYPLMMYFWPSGWRWQPNQPEYEQMILGVYATLGIFLLLASRNPAANRSLIAFTAWSSLVHAAIMAMQAFQNASERGHLMGDIPALVVVGVALILLAPPKSGTLGV
jgi:sterol desaturase/sphingolipid hydroxylase (fatty acid hydroxylase superfamily)